MFHLFTCFTPLSLYSALFIFYYSQNTDCLYSPTFSFAYSPSPLFPRSLNTSKWPNKIKWYFLISYSSRPPWHLILLTSSFLTSFASLDIHGNVTTYAATSYLFFLSFLAKQHFYLRSPKCGYAPWLKLWLWAFFILIIRENWVTATILILNLRELIISPREI